MKILIPIKRVVDYNVKVRPMADVSGVDLNYVKMAINPFCFGCIARRSSLSPTRVSPSALFSRVGGSGYSLKAVKSNGAKKLSLIAEVLPQKVALISWVIESPGPKIPPSGIPEKVCDIVSFSAGIQA